MLFKKKKRSTSTKDIEATANSGSETRTSAGPFDGDEMYSQDRFLKAINEKAENPQNCIFCGNGKYGVVDQMVMLFAKSSLNSAIINQSIPCGVIICKECGHVNLFALGVLGLLPKEDPDARLD